MTSFRVRMPASQAKVSGPDVVDVRTVQSRDAGVVELGAAERLVKDSFGSGFREGDWEHGLGGTHVFLDDAAGSLLGHAAIVPRVITHGTNALSVGYVEAVAIRSDRQGRGLGRVLMDQVETVVRAEYQLGGLNAITDAVPFYLHRGWTSWTGATAATDRAGGIVATDGDEDRIMLLGGVFHGDEIDQSLTLTCDWRPGDPW